MADVTIQVTVQQVNVYYNWYLILLINYTYIIFIILFDLLYLILGGSEL